MRPLPITALAIAVLLAAPASSAVRDEHVFKMTLTEQDRGVSTGVKFSTDRPQFVPKPPGEAADRVVRTVFRMPAGTTTDTGAAGRCTKAGLEERGTDGCPKNSQVGTGSAIALTGITGVDPLRFKVTVFSGRNVLFAHLSGLTSTVIELPMKRNTITADVPRTCFPGGTPADDCKNGEVVLKTLAVKISPRTKGARRR